MTVRWVRRAAKRQQIDSPLASEADKETAADDETVKNLPEVQAAIKEHEKMKSEEKNDEDK